MNRAGDSTFSAGGSGNGRQPRGSSRWSDGGSGYGAVGSGDDYRYSRGSGAGGGFSRGPSDGIEVPCFADPPVRGGAGGDGFSRGGGGGGDGFSGGGGGGGRFHPYRGPQDHGGGFRGGGGEFSGGGGGEGRGFGPGVDRSPDQNKPNSVKLFIGSVPRSATADDIRPLFEGHGDVLEVAFIRDKKTGEQQGCCFVKYATSEEAGRAIRALHNQFTLPGAPGPLQVRYADGERERHGTMENKLFVASLGRHATVNQIEGVFAQFGIVEDVYLMKDGNKQSRGCGFVKFATRDAAQAALNALNGCFIMPGSDQKMVVRFADPKRPRPGESRGGPAFGGPGFSPRSEAALVIRPNANLDESTNRRIPSDPWRTSSPPKFGNFGSDPKMAKAASSTISTEHAGAFGSHDLPSNGSVSNSSTLIQGTNSLMTQVRPMVLPVQQLGHLQTAQSGSLNSYGQMSTLQSVGQLPTSQQLMQLNPSGTAFPAPLNLQQQGVPAAAGQQALGSSNAAQMLPQSQQPSQVPSLLLQQQAQALQSSFQSSQQAIMQLQQQMQLVHQSNQQAAQAPKHQAALAASMGAGGAPGAGVPSVASGTSLQGASPGVTVTCNWTEHTSPEGFKYYYNSVSRESTWEKPDELVLYEQQQQKMLLLKQQQQHQQEQQQTRFIMQQYQTQASQAQQIPQIQPPQQIASAQGQTQIQMKQPQLQILQPPASDLNYAQMQGGVSIDHNRIQQGIQAAQEWAWKGKPAGT